MDNLLDVQKYNYMTENFPQIFYNIRQEIRKPIGQINYHNFFKEIEKSRYNLINPQIAKVDTLLLSNTIDHLASYGPMYAGGSFSNDELVSFYKLFFSLPILDNKKSSHKRILEHTAIKKSKSSGSINVLTAHLGTIEIGEEANSKAIDDLLITSVPKLERLISTLLKDLIHTRGPYFVWTQTANLIRSAGGGNEFTAREPGVTESLMTAMYVTKVIFPLVTFLNQIGIFEPENDLRVFIDCAIPVDPQIPAISTHVIPDITVRSGSSMDSKDIRLLTEVKKPFLQPTMANPREEGNANTISDILKQLFSYLHVSKKRAGILTDGPFVAIFYIFSPFKDIVKPKIGPSPSPEHNISYKCFNLFEVLDDIQVGSGGNNISAQLAIATLILELWHSDNNSQNIDSGNIITAQQRRLLKQVMVLDLELKRNLESNWSESNTRTVNRSQVDSPVSFPIQQISNHEAPGVCYVSQANQAKQFQKDHVDFTLVSRGGYSTPQEVILLTRKEFLKSGLYEAGSMDLSRESIPKEIILKVYDKAIIKEYIMNEVKLDKKNTPEHREQMFITIYETCYNNELASYRRINEHNSKNKGCMINSPRLLGHGYITDMNRYKSAKFILLSKLEYANEKPQSKSEFNLGIEQLKLINALGIAHKDIAMRNICFDKASQKFSIFDFSHSGIASRYDLDESGSLIELYESLN